MEEYLVSEGEGKRKGKEKIGLEGGEREEEEVEEEEEVNNIFK
jgi:hypothetical protein